MARLTESEIFDCLATNFRLAAEDCDKLAVVPEKGFVYHALRSKLKLLEGACRQAAAWRGDARWYPIGLQMEQCHQRAGEWLRGVKTEAGRMPHTQAELHTLFTLLAKALRQLHGVAENLRTKATGKVGLILPTPGRAPHRETRPVQVRTPGGIILPAGAL